MGDEHGIRSRIRLHDIASSLRCSVPELLRIADNAEKLFNPRREQLVKGKWREIDPPTRDGRRIYRLLLSFLQTTCKPNSIVHGGAIGRSCFTGAKVHCGKKLVVTRDIYRCYPSIDQKMMLRALLNIGFRGECSAILSKLLVVRGSVVQGSPASSGALNIVLAGFDELLKDFASANGFGATRTYDDIVVSSNNPTDKKKISEFIESKLLSLGLPHSERKARKRGTQILGREGGATVVHSLVVSRPGGVLIGSQHRESALDMAHRYKACCLSLQSDTILTAAKLRQRAVGWLRHCGQAKYGPHRNLKQLIHSGDRIALKMIIRAGLRLSTKAWFTMQSGINEPRRLQEEWSASPKCGP